MSTISKIRQSDVLLYALPTAWLRSQELETQQSASQGEKIWSVTKRHAERPFGRWKEDDYQANIILLLVWDFSCYIITNMNGKKNQYPQMTYKQAVRRCKYWADEIRHKGLDLLTTDYSEVTRILDQLTYPLYIRTWIDPKNIILWIEFCTYAIDVDNNYTDRASLGKVIGTNWWSARRIR